MSSTQSSLMTAAQKFVADFAPRLAHQPKTSSTYRFVCSLLENAHKCVMPATPAILDVGSELRLAAYRRFRLPHPITTIEFKPYGDSRLIERIIGIAWSPEIPNATTPEMSLPDGYRPVDGFFCASLIKTNDAARPFYLDPMFGFIAYHGPANPHSDAAPTVLFAAMPELTKNFTKARWSSHCASSHDFLGMTHEALVTYASSNEPVSLNG